MLLHKTVTEERKNINMEDPAMSLKQRSLRIHSRILSRALAIENGKGSPRRDSSRSSSQLHCYNIKETAIIHRQEPKPLSFIQP